MKKFWKDYSKFILIAVALVLIAASIDYLRRDPSLKSEGFKKVLEQIKADYKVSEIVSELKKDGAMAIGLYTENDIAPDKVLDIKDKMLKYLYNTDYADITGSSKFKDKPITLDVIFLNLQTKKPYQILPGIEIKDQLFTATDFSSIKELVVKAKKEDKGVVQKDVKNSDEIQKFLNILPSVTLKESLAEREKDNWFMACEFQGFDVKFFDDYMMINDKFYDIVKDSISYTENNAEQSFNVNLKKAFDELTEPATEAK